MTAWAEYVGVSNNKVQTCTLFFSLIISEITYAQCNLSAKATQQTIKRVMFLICFCISLLHSSKTLLWSAKREVSIHSQCCHCLSLSSPSSDLSIVKEMCVCVCVYWCCFPLPLPSSLFLFLFFSRVFLPNICHPPFNFPLSLLTLFQPTKTYHWLPWDSVAMQQQGFHVVLRCMCLL